MGIFERKASGSPDPVTLLADQLRGIRSWLRPHVKQSLDGTQILTFSTRPGRGWIVTYGSHGWTGMKAEIDDEGDAWPSADASPVLLHPTREPGPELTAVLLALCADDLTRYVKDQAAAPEHERDGDWSVAWAEAELESLRGEGRIS